MYDFTLDANTPKAERYAFLNQSARALTAGEHDITANLANIAALMWHILPDINWAGFYRMADAGLVLGPFAGKPACIRIPLGQGVCGTAASTHQVQVVADVHAFPGHIACDAASASEIVVPIMRGTQCLGVLDIDSPITARFDDVDAAGLTELAQICAEFWS